MYCTPSELNLVLFSLKEILDLGIQPFADTFIPESRLTEIENTYPLVCQLCNSCKNIQLKYITDPNKRYNDFEYSYTSSLSRITLWLVA